MIKRAVKDRRIKNQKVEVNQRKNLRREEDVKNIRAYYATIFSAFTIIITFFTISILQK